MLIELEFLASADCTDLMLEGWIDQHKIFESTARQSLQVVTYDLDDTPGTHVLKLGMHGKNSSHTVIDATGQIVADVYFEVVQLKVDSIEVRRAFFGDQPCYTHDFNGNCPVSQHRFWGPMGCNGTVEIPFSTPIFPWLFGINAANIPG